MKASVIVFPGSNCDRDVAVSLEQAMGQKPNMVWHADSELPPSDLIVIPGGFSYGDYLRCGAIAGNAHFIRPVKEAAEKRRHGPWHLQRVSGVDPKRVFCPVP